jgi:hypothetical protein
MRATGNLRHHGDEPTNQIKRQIASAAHRILNLWTEGPKKNHVADDVRPAAMHEHGSQNSDPVVAGSDLRRDRRPLGHECIAAGEFENKNNDVHQDDSAGNDRHAHGAPRRIAQWDQAAHVISSSASSRTVLLSRRGLASIGEQTVVRIQGPKPP